MKNIILVLILACFIMAGCATLKVEPPADCENSIVHKHAPWSFVMLTAGVDGLWCMSASKPELYGQLQQSARQVEILLQRPGITYRQLSEAPDIYMLLLSQIASIFPPDQIIDKCDRDILTNYLRMI